MSNGKTSPLTPGRKDRPVNPIGACLVAFVLLGVGFVVGLLMGGLLWR